MPTSLSSRSARPGPSTPGGSRRRRHRRAGLARRALFRLARPGRRSSGACAKQVAIAQALASGAPISAASWIWLTARRSSPGPSLRRWLERNSRRCLFRPSGRVLLLRTRRDDRSVHLGGERCPPRLAHQGRAATRPGAHAAQLPDQPLSTLGRLRPGSPPVRRGPAVLLRGRSWPGACAWGPARSRASLQGAALQLAGLRGLLLARRFAYLCPESQCAKEPAQRTLRRVHDGLCRWPERECIWGRAYERSAYP